MNGILLINKESGYTSRDIVNIVSKNLQTKKVGHTGTLDPLATGLLVLCVGNYTKFVELLTNHEKEYIAEFEFGIETDTLDITGKIENQNPTIPTQDELLASLQKWTGTHIQTVPRYSAKKIKGKKLYEYARKNESVDLPKITVEISSLELLDFQKNKAKIFCHVSKGTYIRSLIKDICLDCKSIGTMTSLNRTKQGNFLLTNAYTLEEIKQNKFQLLTYKDILKYETYELSKEEYKKVKNGNELFLNLELSFVLLTHQKKEIALYQKKEKSYKPLLQFDK